MPIAKSWRATRRVGPGGGALVLAVLVLAAGCGSRLPSDVLARVDAGRAGSVVSGAGPGPGAGGSGPADPAAQAVGPSPDALDTGTTPAGAPVGGTTASGPATASRAGVATTLPAAIGRTAATLGGQAATCGSGTSTEKGVAPKELKFASIVTASGPLPGATEGAYRGAAAYFAMINSQGGVCGRKLTLLKGDDSLDSARARSEFVRLEPQVLGFVGNLAVADSGYIDLLRSTAVPYVSQTVDASGASVRSVVPKTPEGVISTAPFVYYKQRYPAATKVGYLVSDVASVVVLSPPTEMAIERAGFTIAYRSPAGVTDPDYTSHVIRMRNAGVQFVFLFAFEINMQVRLARNMRQQNWNPEIKMNQIGYNTKWYDTMGADANGWKTFITYLPMLNPDELARSPALGPFAEWNKRLFPKDQQDLFPVFGWGNAAYLVDALRRIGPDISRAKLVEALYQVPTIDSGGLTPPTKAINTDEASLCFIAVKAEEGRWQREWPATGFECSIGERFKYK